MSCPFLTPLPSSSLAHPRPTSEPPPHRPHYESWRQSDEIHIPTSCQFPDLQVKDSASKPFLKSKRSFHVSSGGNLQSHIITQEITSSSPPRVRLQIRPATTAAIDYERMTYPSAVKLPLLPATNTVRKPQQVVASKRSEFDTTRMVAPNSNSAFERKVKVAGQSQRSHSNNTCNNTAINTKDRIAPTLAVPTLGKRKMLNALSA